MKLIGISHIAGSLMISWPNGFEGDPKILIQGLHFDCEGGNNDPNELVKCLGEYLVEHADKLKERSSIINMKGITMSPTYRLNIDYCKLTPSSHTIKMWNDSDAKK